MMGFAALHPSYRTQTRQCLHWLFLKFSRFSDIGLTMMFLNHQNPDSQGEEIMNTVVSKIVQAKESLRFTNRERKVNISRVVSLEGNTGKGIYRINHPIEGAIPGVSFSFNQYLLLDENPLLWETGPRDLFPYVREAVATVMDPARLRYIAFSHHENDEDGAANEWLAEAPGSVILTSGVNNMINGGTYIRPARTLKDGEELALGSMTVRFLATPHFPHGWEAGLMFETTTRALLASDLFTQTGTGEVPLREACPIKDIGYPLFDELDPGSWGWTRNHESYFSRLIQLNPQTLCCMHGSAFTGEYCPGMLKELCASLKEKCA